MASVFLYQVGRVPSATSNTGDSKAGDSSLRKLFFPICFIFWGGELWWKVFWGINSSLSLLGKERDIVFCQVHCQVVGE